MADVFSNIGLGLSVAASLQNLVYCMIGVLLGTFVAPGFFGLSAFVGAGLMFAGVTGWCGMANLLRVMPWNRRATA